MDWLAARLGREPSSDWTIGVTLAGLAASVIVMSVAKRVQKPLTGPAGSGRHVTDGAARDDAARSDF